MFLESLCNNLTLDEFAEDYEIDKDILKSVLRELFKKVVD